MKLLPIVVTFSSLVSALPASTTTNDAQASDAGYLTPAEVANCEPGRRYCYEQIVRDLDVPKQTILHQYCDQQYTVDAMSCHACHKLPWPLDYCWDGPGAWNSVFTCKGGQEYDFAERCDWCEAGQCV